MEEYLKRYLQEQQEIDERSQRIEEQLKKRVQQIQRTRMMFDGGFGEVEHEA